MNSTHQTSSAEPQHDIGYVLRICAVAALGGLLFGYDTAVISGAIGSIKAFFGLNAAQTGWAVSNVVIGCIVGSLSAGAIAGRMGRKRTLIMAALMFTISALGSALVDSFSWFVFYRMLGGLAVGIASTISPMYMSEVSPKHIRGQALGMQQGAIVFGQVVVFYVNYKIAQGTAEEWLVNYGWRWMLGSEALPCALFLATVYFIPESPRWQAMVGQEKQALDTLTRISNRQHAKALLHEIKVSLHLERKEADSNTSFINKSFLLIVFVGCMIAFMQQIQGINVMMYYAPMVLEKLAGDTETALFMTIWIGVTQLIGSLIAMGMIDRVGRMPLMRWGTIGVIASLLYTSFTMYAGLSAWVVLPGMLAFMLVFGLSWGIGSWVLISEVFPNNMRSLGMSCAVSSAWIGNFLVTQFFPIINENAYLLEHFNGAFPMWLFAGCSVVCYWFIGRFVPETKGVPLESMEEVMLAKIRGDERAVEELSSMAGAQEPNRA